ncbi:unnamed protein product, partial [Vitis vinifera]
MQIIRRFAVDTSSISRVFRVLPYSTETLTSNAPKESLQSRISPAIDLRVSIVPALEQWRKEGRSIKQQDLHRLIRKLRTFKRYNHALEIYEWIRDKFYFDISPGDVAIQLDLISKVHGLEQAEKYFNETPNSLRSFQVYGALLNCYSQKKSLEKAEAIMQEMRDMGFVKTLSYNVMLGLYSRLGKHEKLDNLMQEMEENGIGLDSFTYCIRLNAYCATSDMEGMEKLLMKLETDPAVNSDWNAYIVAANGYLKADLKEKAVEMLKNSLLKLDDMDGAEKTFEEWLSGNKFFDFRVPNLLIRAYCKKGLLEKAEQLVSRAIEQGEEPIAVTWDALAAGYHENNQMEKAVDTLKKALLATSQGWKPNPVTLSACLEYLKGKGDVEEAENLIRLLREQSLVSAYDSDRLVNYIRSEEPGSSTIAQMLWDHEDLDAETDGVVDLKQESIS